MLNSREKLEINETVNKVQDEIRIILQTLKQEYEQKFNELDYEIDDLKKKIIKVRDDGA